MSKTFILGNPDVDASFITVEMTWDGVFRDPRIKDHVGRMPPASFEEITPKSVINTYIEKEGMHIFANASADALLGNPDLIEHLKRNTLDLAEEMRMFADRHVGVISDKDHTELADILSEAKRLQSDCGAYGTVVAFADIFGAVTNRLTDIARERSDLQYPVSHYTNAMSTPREASYTQLAYQDIQASGKEPSELAEEYYWLDQGYIGRGLSVHEVEALQKTEKGSMDDDPDAIVAELGLSEEEQKIADIAQGIVFTKMMRADARQNLHVLVNRVVDRLAEEWGVSAQHLEALSGNELCDLISKGQVPPSDISERLHNGVVVPKGERDEGYDVYTGSEAIAYLSQYVEDLREKSGGSVEGQVAYKGTIRGTVRLLFGPQHIKKVNEGDVLVSPSTSPQLLPAMKKAAAFVTDIGGITSHAAIVAREMQKPCIVGTQNATQVFQDGDEVEVDGENGVVKILG